MSLRSHEHFCSLCFNQGGGVASAVGGWWKCADQKCTRLSSAMCKKHREQLKANTDPRFRLEMKHE